MPVIIKYIKGFLDNLLYICFTLFSICIFFCKKRYNGNKAGSGLSQYDFYIFFYGICIHFNPTFQASSKYLNVQEFKKIVFVPLC